jgi:hypothetical protein
MSYCTFKYSGLKDSPLFMRVHAITSSLLSPLPFSPGFPRVGPSEVLVFRREEL